MVLRIILILLLIVIFLGIILFLSLIHILIIREQYGEERHQTVYLSGRY